MGQKVGPQTHDHNSVKSEPIWKKITRKFLGKFVVKRIHCAAVAALRWKKRFLWCLTSAAQQRAAYVWTAPNTFVKLRRFLFCLSFSSFASQYCVSAVIKELVTTPDGQASLSGDVFSVTDISVLTELCWIALGRNAAYCCRCSAFCYKQQRGCLMHFAHMANTLLEAKKVHETSPSCP